MRFRTVLILLAATLVLVAPAAASAQCPVSVPVEGAAPPAPLPLFPPDNWWNQDIRSAPVDPGSASYIAFINNGGTRRLHPDFGGEASPGSVDIYGMPYAIVDGTQPKQAVTFDYWDESDGVNYATGQGVPFYPLPAQAITQAHWVEGGAPANVDQRSAADRHLLVIDCTNRTLYELYNVYYNATLGKWYAGSGAFFDMKTNNRRPDTLDVGRCRGPRHLSRARPLRRRVESGGDRYRPRLPRDRARHERLRVPGFASRRIDRRRVADGRAAALEDQRRRPRPRAAHHRSERAEDLPRHAEVRAHRGRQRVRHVHHRHLRHALEQRHPEPGIRDAHASDFEVVQLGWNPAPTGLPSVASFSASPNPVAGGSASTGTVTLTAAAPAGGAAVTLSSASSAVTVPASATVAQGANAVTFAIATAVVAQTTAATLTASYNGTNATTTFTVNPALPPTLTKLTLNPTTVSGGNPSVGTVTLAAPAPAGGALVTLKSSNPAAAAVPPSVLVAAGATTQTFTVTTAVLKRSAAPVISATYAGVKKTATLTIKRG